MLCNRVGLPFTFFLSLNLFQSIGQRKNCKKITYGNGTVFAMFNLKLIFRQCVRIFVNYNKKVYFEFRNARTTKVQVVIITMMLHSSTKTGELSKHLWPS